MNDEAMTTSVSAPEGTLTLKNLTELMKGITQSGSTDAHTPAMYLINPHRLRGKRNHYRYRELMRHLRGGRMIEVDRSDMRLVHFPPWIVGYRPTRPEFHYGLNHGLKQLP